MTTIRFPEVTRKCRMSEKCDSCGKRFTKTLSVTHTVNPFNKDESGLMKTPQRVSNDVMADLRNKIERFKQAPRCSKCLDRAAV